MFGSFIGVIKAAVTNDGSRQNKLSRMYRDSSRKTAVICGYDVDRGKDLEMRIRHTSLTAMLAAASTVLASTLAAAPPAATVLRAAE
jgi:hypothetical protein